MPLQFGVVYSSAAKPPHIYNVLYIIPVQLERFHATTLIERGVVPPIE
jgi:hypothetical protein